MADRLDEATIKKDEPRKIHSNTSSNVSNRKMKKKKKASTTKRDGTAQSLDDFENFSEDSEVEDGMTFANRVFNEKVKKKATEGIMQYYSKKLNQDEGNLPKGLEKDQQGIFDNLDIKVISPRGKSPAPDEAEVTREEWESAVPHTIIETTEYKFFFFSCMARLAITFWLTFPFIMMKFGGWAFLFPFIVCTALVTIPMMYLEFALGQFTSLPACIVFIRMRPILGGIGVAVLFIQLFATATYKLEPRYAAIGIIPSLQMFVGLRNADCFSSHGYDACYVANLCPPLTTYYQGNCLPDDLFQSFPLPSVQLKFMMKQLLQYGSKEDQQERFSKAERFLNAKAPNNMLLVSKLTILLITFFLARTMGVVFHAEFTIYIIGMILVAALRLCFYHTIDDFLMYFEVIGFDLGMIMRWDTWLVAAVMSLTIFCVGDGSLFSLGSMNQFGNKILKKQIYQVIFGFLLFLVINIPLCVGSVAGIIRSMTVSEKRKYTAAEIREELVDLSKVFDSLLYFSFTQGEMYCFVLSMTMLGITLLQTSHLVIFAESVFLITYRMFQRLVNLPRTVARNFVLIFFMVSLVTINNYVKETWWQNVFRSLPLAILAELIGISLFSFKKIVAIFSALLDTSISHRYLWYIFYQILLPIPVLMIAVGIIYNSATYLFIFILFTSTSFLFSIYLLKNNLSKVWKTSSYWGPHRSSDRAISISYLRTYRLNA